MTMTLRQPYGVVALIIPWNVPCHFLAIKSAPALITGNTVVLKSSEKAPLAVARIAELIVEAGFPLGVFNLAMASPLVRSSPGIWMSARWASPVQAAPAR